MAEGLTGANGPEAVAGNVYLLRQPTAPFPAARNERHIPVADCGLEAPDSGVPAQIFQRPRSRWDGLGGPLRVDFAPEGASLESLPYLL